LVFSSFSRPTATTEIYSLSLHDALPIWLARIIGEVRYAVAEEGRSLSSAMAEHPQAFPELCIGTIRAGEASGELGYALRQLVDRSEEHTSELQSRENLVCRLLLEKKNKT